MVTFPVLSGLRMYDFRVVDIQPGSGQTCDHISEPSFVYLPDGALKVTNWSRLTERSGFGVQHVHGFHDPRTRTNDAPAWTAQAPENGTKIPTSGTGTWRFATAETGNAWALTAMNGPSMRLDDSGWGVSTNAPGDFFITQPEGDTNLSHLSCR